VQTKDVGKSRGLFRALKNIVNKRQSEE